MDKSLSFFRVFDIAFFAPGMLLFGAIMYSYGFPIDNSSWKDDAVQGVFIGVFAIALIYLLGLICHGIQRIVLWLKWLVHKKRNKPKAWYTNLRKDNPRYELIMYFWYMRSTCWNLVVSIVLVAIICYLQHKLTFSLSELVMSIFVIGLLMFLGYEFDESMREAAS